LTKSSLRWGWVFLERAQILSGIQFTTHFIDFFVVETKKRFVGSFVNVILMRQTCGQRTHTAAESKRQALGNFFSERICYLFLISKCRGDRDLGLCNELRYLRLENRSPMAKSEEKNVFRRRKNRILPLRCGSQNAIPKLCTDLDLGLLCILIVGTHSKFTRKNNFLALSVCSPQLCSSAGRRFAASRSRLQNYRRIVIPNPTLSFGISIEHNQTIHMKMEIDANMERL